MSLCNNRPYCLFSFAWILLLRFFSSITRNLTITGETALLRLKDIFQLLAKLYIVPMGMIVKRFNLKFLL